MQISDISRGFIMDAAVKGRVVKVEDGRNLLENLALIDAASWESAPEVYAAFRRGEDALSVVVNNVADYTLVDGKGLFSLFPGVLFSDLGSRQRVYNGIVGNEFLVLPPDMAAVHENLVKNKRVVVQVPYSGLTVSNKGCGGDYCFVVAGPNNTDGDKRLLSAFYGEVPGSGRMVFLLRQSALEIALKSVSDSRVVRACYFSLGQNFFADYRFIYDFCLSAVRGVRIAAEGGAPKN